MRQLVQDLRSGETHLEEVAAPRVGTGHLLVQTRRSLVSMGTERSLTEFGKASYVGKAKQQPEKVKAVIDKVRTDGLFPTMEAVKEQLDRRLPLGYSNAGEVVEVGADVQGFRLGDRVASNGPHAEFVNVTPHLCAKIPDHVSDEQAAFTVIGAVGLQGVRLLEPRLGESVAVFGLGLVGLLASQILRAHGARVMGFDVESGRVELARRLGVSAVDLSTESDPVAAGLSFSGDNGVDAVLITASTESSGLIHQAAQMSRKRGRVVLTGVTGLELRRSDFYEKELTFQVSCSYGPGRYDPKYEQGGNDYPIGFVRWTEQRNFGAVLDLLEQGSLQVDELITHRLPLHDAPSTYSALSDPGAIGIVLEYPVPPRADASRRTISHLPSRASQDIPVLAVVGCGAFSQAKLLPAIGRTPARLKWVASAKGLSGAQAARRFQAERSTTDPEAVLSDPEVDAVVIATPHNTHAALTIAALDAGKSVFVEKPLCIKEEDLELLASAYERVSKVGARRPIVMVGFNRRFAPLTHDMKRMLRGRQQPLAIVLTVNAGPLDPGHWVLDPTIGGGRILAEACHFIDLAQHLAGAPVTRVHATAPEVTGNGLTGDTATITLSFADGSIAQVNYFTNGSKAYQKETVEVFSDGRVLRLDNFRRLHTYGFPVRQARRLPRSQDKGHDAEVGAFITSIQQGADSPIPFDEIAVVTKATFAVLQSLHQERPVCLG